MNNKKTKYKYNNKTFEYEKIEFTIGTLVFKILKYLFSGVIIGGISLLLAFPFIKEYSLKELRVENKILHNNYNNLEERLDTVNIVLKGLENTDNNLYRAMFSSEPLKQNDVNNHKIDEFSNSNQIIKLLNSKLNTIEKNIVNQSKSYDEIVKLLANKEKLINSIPSIMPVDAKDLKRIASGFGYRTDPIYRITKFHSGLDFTAPTGSEIYCTADGVVEEMSFNSGGYGNHIIINHGFGYKTHYAHLSQFKSSIGKHVKRGEVIGYVGSTGKSTGAHLHYEVLKNEIKIDPANFFYNDLNQSEYEELVKKANNINQSLD